VAKVLYNMYVEKDRTDVCVIGGASIDIFGSSTSRIIPEDSNIGTITYCFGGVGRNIANNLSKLGIDVELICVLGNDDNAKRIIEHCKQENIGLNHYLKVDKPSASYLSINQPEGDIYVAIADMSINDCLTKDFLNKHLEFINSCKVIVLDTNLSTETFEYMLSKITTTIYVDPVSGKKAMKLPNDLTKVTAIKPNLLEAKTILKKDGKKQELVNGLLDKGIKEVYLTLGSEGVISSNKEECLKVANYPGNIVNTTGCGDAFLAGIIYGELKEVDLLRKTQFGLAAASICCRSLGSISEYLNEEELIKIVR